MLSAGIDLGGTKCLGVVVDDRAAVVHERRVPTPSGVDAVVSVLEQMVLALAAEGGEHMAVGLGVPGLVDRDGTLRFAPNLPRIEELPLGRLLEKRLGRPVVVDNDATCAAWGEFEAGAARAANHAILVTLGTGIGVGIVAKGQVLRGANGFAGEAGHMMVDPDGPRCPCGRRGCWERYASGSGLGRLGRDAALAGRLDAVVELAGGDPENVRGEHVTAAARAGDMEAVEVVGDFGWWVAVGIANLVNLLDPEMVVVGGGLVEAGDILLEPVRRSYGGLVLAAEHRPEMMIVPAELGEHAGAVGAALLARSRIAQPPPG